MREFIGMIRLQVCRQRYGAPIQCTTVGCYAAFHPLCARAAGYQMHMREESEAESREMQLKHNQKTQLSRGAGLRMLSLCKRCGPPTLLTSTTSTFAAAAGACPRARVPHRVIHTRTVCGCRVSKGHLHENEGNVP